jgi:RNA polymerase sigma-70 factor (ECF subfamily)
MMKGDQNITDVAAFKTFFLDFYPSLCLFVNKYLNDKEASNDIVQDAFLYIWNKRDEIISVDSAKAYLYKHVKNRSLNYLRDQKNKKKHNLVNVESEYFFRDNLVEEETYQILYKALNNLPPQGQRVIELSLDGFKNQEIADKLEISINTVKTIKLRAFQSLRSELKINVFSFFFMNKG